jgi:hypothetical protein
MMNAMNIGQVFALAEQLDLLPAEPLKRLISGCTGVPTLEFILLVAQYDGTDCQNVRQNLTWKALSRTYLQPVDVSQGRHMLRYAS